MYDGGPASVENCSMQYLYRALLQHNASFMWGKVNDFELYVRFILNKCSSGPKCPLFFLHRIVKAECSRGTLLCLLVTSRPVFASIAGLNNVPEAFSLCVFHSVRCDMKHWRKHLVCMFVSVVSLHLMTYVWYESL